MARSRILKPGFFRNEDLAELPPMTRLLFAGLWTLADKEGRLEDRPKRIRADLFPYDELTGADVDGMLGDLFGAGFIVRYEAEGVAVVQIAKWHDHQSPHHKEAESDLPELPEVVEGQRLAKHESSMSQACGNVASSNVLVTSNKQQVTSNKKISASDRFEEFWSAYPRVRRRDAKAARKAWDKAVRAIRGRDGPGGDDPAAFLIRRAKQYADSELGSGEFSKMPASWLNAGSYDDDDQAWSVCQSNGRSTKITPF